MNLHVSVTSQCYKSVLQVSVTSLCLLFISATVYSMCVAAGSDKWNIIDKSTSISLIVNITRTVKLLFNSLRIMLLFR